MKKALEDAGITSGKIGIINVNAATDSCVNREEGFRAAFDGTDFVSKKTAGKTDGFLLLILLFQSSPHTWYSMNNILFISDYLSESFVITDTPVSVTSPPSSSPLIAFTAAFTPSDPIRSGF